MQGERTRCPGSNEEPIEITIEPKTFNDGYGNLCGSYGRGKCSTCSREIGLTKMGKVTAHKPAR